MAIGDGVGVIVAVDLESSSSDEIFVVEGSGMVLPSHFLLTAITVALCIERHIVLVFKPHKQASGNIKKLSTN